MKMELTLQICVALFSFFTFTAADYPPPCESNIYCHGPLLHTIQMAGIYKDSKTFVDMKLKYPPDQVLRNFDMFMRRHEQTPPTADVQSFINENFDKEGSEFVKWNPSDWHDNPEFLKNISDPRLRTWATQLHSYWKELGRKINDDVKNRPELYSMIYVSNPVIVPGGRFREFFYWDSYWIMKGLLLSEMHATVKGMLENFIEMVNLLGYVPNGGRVYFIRSQPPLLIPMVKLYLDNTKDIDFLRANLPSLDKEFDFWMKNRTFVVQKNGKSYRVARYNVELTGPRPESYREDYALAEKLSTDAEKHELYFNIKAGAESGWDFSSRWFSPPPGVLKGNLSHTKVRDIIPADLNAFIHLNAKLLAEFHNLAGNPTKAAEYENLANQWKTTINELMWDEEMGCWFDYDVKNNNLRRHFYPSNIAPLWAGVHNSETMAMRVVQYLRNVGALNYPGGVPTSLLQAGEQWDFPNGWAPLQHLVVDALDKSGSSEGAELAFELSERWISSNYKAFIQSAHMFEKYDVTAVGLEGGGGEYEVVVGFGWTNGVALDFMNRYGDRIRAPTVEKASAANSFPNYVTNSIAFGGVSVLLASLIGISKAGKQIRKGRCEILGLSSSCCGEYSQLPVSDDEMEVFPSVAQAQDVNKTPIQTEDYPNT